jgi:glutaredoxin
MKYPSIFTANCLLISLLLSGGAHAQLYKWVGPDGKVNYSDTPPPVDAKKVETKTFSGTTPAVSLPADLAAAVAKNPVVLYTAPTCKPCNEGRALLKQLGIPFSEKTVSSNEDIDKLKQISGDTQLPLLIISNIKVRGLDSAEWRVALNSAGYPDTNKLPKDYQYPAAVSAAPQLPSVKKESAEKNTLPKIRPASESGIRF